MTSSTVSVGDMVWIVAHHHTWDAINCHQYHPVKAKVTKVDNGTAFFESHEERPFIKCFASEEECDQACPENHP